MLTQLSITVLAQTLPKPTNYTPKQVLIYMLTLLNTKPHFMFICFV